MDDDTLTLAEEFAKAKAEGFKQSTVSKLIAAAIAGRKLSFPAGVGAGAAGGEVSLPSFYTLSSYLGTSYGARHYLIGPNPVYKNVPGFIKGPTKFLFGPIAVAATVGGVVVRKYFFPQAEDESPFITIPFSLLTGGLEKQPLFPDIPEILRGTFFDLYAYGHQHNATFADVLQLIPVWEADP